MQQAQSLSRNTLEKFFYQKRLIRLAGLKDTLDNRLIQVFEQKYGMAIPDREIENLGEFLNALSNRQLLPTDLMLLSYFKARLPTKTDEEKRQFEAFCETFNINLEEPNEGLLDIPESVIEEVRRSNAPSPSGTITNLSSSDSSQRQSSDYMYDAFPFQSSTPEVNIQCVRVESPPLESHRVRVEQPYMTISAEEYAKNASDRAQKKYEEQKDKQVPYGLDTNIFDGLTTYKQFSEFIDATYWDNETHHSTALDIIAVYLKGQKILYIEAKTHCEQHLSMMMLPAIFLSAACTVISVATQGHNWGSILVSSLTALNSFILSLVSYLKLDAKAEAHKSSSYQFEKLQIQCEFHSGKVLFFNDKKSDQMVNDIEKKVSEIKDANQFIIPEIVRYKFPTLYTTNVFTEVKKIENDESVLKNRLNYLFLELYNMSFKEKTKEELERYADLKDARNRLLNEYLQIRNRYLKLDKQFNEEIEIQIRKSHGRYNPCNWLKN